MGVLIAPHLEVGRIVSYHPTPDTHQDAIVSAILDGRVTPALELRIWVQATDLIVLLPLVEHKDNVLPNASAWDWIDEATEIADPSVAAVGQTVAYYEVPSPAQLIYHEAIITARLSEGLHPALEVRYWDQGAGHDVRVGRVEHRETVGSLVNHYRGIDE